VAAEKALDLAKRAKDIFMSSKLDEKQPLLRFMFSNLRLDGENLLLEVREPFLTLVSLRDQPVWCA
jgi:hypothetical protein